MIPITNAVYDYGSTVPIEIFHAKEKDMVLKKYKDMHPNKLVRIDDNNNIQIH